LLLAFVAVVAVLLDDLGAIGKRCIANGNNVYAVIRVYI
jgi:hypothetical protein